MLTHRKKGHVSTHERPQEEPTLTAPWSLQDWEKIDSCSSSHPVYGILLSQTNSPTIHVLLRQDSHCSGRFVVSQVFCSLHLNVIALDPLWDLGKLLHLKKKKVFDFLMFKNKGAGLNKL